MDVLQCPFCQLRFTTRSELDQHKAFDHPDAEKPADKADKSADKEDETPPRRGLL